MANLNKVLLIGRLTRDPELRYTPQGTAVCTLGIATNRFSRNADGSMREETTFVDVTVWAKQAENCAEYLKKGREVFIEGHLTLDRWESPDGQKRSKLHVTAERVQFLGGARGGGGGKEEAPSEEESAPQGGENVPF